MHKPQFLTLKFRHVYDKYGLTYIYIYIVSLKVLQVLMFMVVIGVSDLI